MTRRAHVRDVDLRTANQRARKRRLAEAGLCRSCANRPARPGQTACDACAERRNESNRQKRALRPVGCRHCGSREHITKRCGRDVFGPKIGARIARIGPIVARKMGIVTVVPVLSSWLVRG